VNCARSDVPIMWAILEKSAITMVHLQAHGGTSASRVQQSLGMLSLGFEHSASLM